MKVARYSILVLICLSFGFKVGKKKVVIGYVGGYRGLVNTAAIEVEKLTHINYAFVDIKDNKAWLHQERTDTVNFRNLNALRQRNKDIKILISIGGWTWSGKFSDAMLSDTSRLTFAKSAVGIIERYNLDGIDIDWEYPGLHGAAGNVFRLEDKQNYTLMFKTLREQLDSLQQITRKSYLLTTAVGAFPGFVSHTDMGEVQKYLDYVNLMTYDFGGSPSVHQSNLYPTADYGSENSADKAFNDFTKAGVPAEKLVMGIPFYGRGYEVEDAVNHGLGRKVISSIKSGGFTFISDSLENKKGYKKFWDRKAKVPYLFNKQDRHFIAYDDRRSVKEKCAYVLRKDMAGVMYWEHDSDLKGYLLTEIHNYLLKKKAVN
ncbi:glycoside hydrolase family 18 protein [Pedobacter duraquae]|uniref:chitinase n=1 Tax=Pedobacter duraquae TaxID=425511 RepID=A0A4V3C416_9SPHI|nr:glycoside hydrolase family 18 protein [Pedobacter duraquae]TDO24238.1 chitinase [Pedobacter duraquae]